MNNRPIAPIGVVGRDAASILGGYRFNSPDPGLGVIHKCIYIFTKKYLYNSTISYKHKHYVAYLLNKRQYITTLYHYYNYYLNYRNSSNLYSIINMDY